MTTQKGHLIKDYRDKYINEHCKNEQKKCTNIISLYNNTTH